MIDRNMIDKNGYTIMWTDFANLYGIPETIKDMSYLLNHELIKRNLDNGQEEKTISLSYIARSIIKLQSLGVLQCDFVTTSGTTSPNYIDRFHVTFFGQKLLEYIDTQEQKES